MSFKQNMIKWALLALWIVLGAGVLVLTVAAINIKNHKVCKGVDIVISGVEKFLFLDKRDIMELLFHGGRVKPEGKMVAEFNLQNMEALLEHNVWVRKAELFFDNNMILHINIEEKEPVARIFTKTGNSFYIDSSGSRMPLSEKMSVRLPVFTGFPVMGLRRSSADSLLLEHVKMVSQYILKDKFWMAQIAQVQITPNRNFEMVPTIGNHIIEFGNGENYKSKFERLFVFYRQVVRNTGLDKYARLNVQFDKQVVGTRKGPMAKTDSIQAMKNIRNMIEEAMRRNEDSMFSSPEPGMGDHEIPERGDQLP